VRLESSVTARILIVSEYCIAESAVLTEVREDMVFSERQSTCMLLKGNMFVRKLKRMKYGIKICCYLSMWTCVHAELFIHGG